MKKFQYKIYDKAGTTLLATWIDVVTDPSFTISINGGFSDMTLRLARPILSYGEAVDIAYGNQLKLYVSDAESGQDGILIYTGYISLYIPYSDGQKEYLDVTFLSYWGEFGRHLLENGVSSTVDYSLRDPSTILTDLLDRFTTDGGKLDYAGGTIDMTGASSAYTFNTCTYLDAIQKVIELLPNDWYLRIGADNLVYLKQRGTTPDHEFTIGKNITMFKPEKRIENLVNIVSFTGGGGLFKKYVAQQSVINFGKYAMKYVDTACTDEGTADDIAHRILNTFSYPEVRVQVNVLDSNNAKGKGYDIESIKVGQMCKIFNIATKAENQWDVMLWDSDSWDYNMGNAVAIVLWIQSVEYHPDYAVLQLSNRQPDIAKRVEDINKKLVSSLTVANPATPLVENLPL